jgi:hypothetical protein
MGRGQTPEEAHPDERVGLRYMLRCRKVKMKTYVFDKFRIRFGGSVLAA